MSEITIGRLLFKLRERAGLPIKDITEGICSQSTYSRYESDKCMPDMMTTSCVLERLGQDSSGIQYAFSHSEAEAYKVRKILDEALKYDELTKCEDLIDNYYSQFSKKKLHLQYIDLIKGRLCEENGDKNKAVKYYYEGYTLTHSDETILTQPLYSVAEFELLISYLSNADVKTYWHNLHDYLMKQENYNILKIKFLGFVTKKLCEELANTREKVFCLENTLDYLRKVKSLDGTLTLIEYKINNSEIVSYTNEEYALYHSVKAALNLRKREKITDSFLTKGNLIRSLRLELNMTQEELANGICSVTALARYEGGKLEPGREKFGELLQKMNRDGENYRFSYNAGLFSDFEAYMEIEKHFEKHEEREAVRDYYVNSILTDAVMSENEKDQIRKKMTLIDSYSQGHVDMGSYISELEKIIRESIPDYEEGNFSNNRILDETEISILNVLGAAYNANGQFEGRDAVYKNLADYVFENNMPFNSSITKALTNYAEFLGESGKLDDCYELSCKTVNGLLDCSTQNMLYISLYSIGCYLHEKYKSDTEEKSRDKDAKMLVECSLALGRYFDESEVALGVIEGYYNGNWTD